MRFGDWGYVRFGNSKLISDFKDLIIHPIQLHEIVARFTYVCSQVNRENYALIIMDEEGIKYVGIKPSIKLWFNHEEYFNILKYLFVTFGNAIGLVYDEK